jgi:hypothetical protein
MFIYFLINESYTYERVVLGDEENTIKEFVTGYYTYLGTIPDDNHASGWYLNNNINFYVSDILTTANRELIARNDEKEFIRIRHALIDEVGNIDGFSFKSITFAHTVDDETITVHDLYYVMCDVAYSNKKTAEELMLKKINGEFRIYRHIISIL